MPLDSYTLLVATCGLLTLFGLAFVFLWVLDRSAWLLWWGIPTILTGLAILFYTRDTWHADFISIAFGNAARMAALGCLWYGIRVFQGRPPLWGTISAICFIWVGLCYFPPFFENLAARIAVASVIFSILSGIAAFELWRDRADGLRSRIPTAAIFTSFSILMLVRASLSGAAPFPVGAGPVDPLWLAGFVWLTIGHIMFAAIFFLAMTMERREAEQRNFAMSDPLTGLLNRRALTDFSQRLSRRRSGQRDPLALLVLDLDRFKAINDQFGHDIGDRMLKAFAEASELAMRPTDQLFRMGGEEFCYIFPDTSLDEALRIAERIRKSFEGVEIETANGTASATVSIGIAATHFAINVDVLLAAADAALYEAKARGRNRVVVADPATLLPGKHEATPQRRRA